MRWSNRRLVAGAAATAVVVSAVIALTSNRLDTFWELIGGLATLAGLLGGLLKWARPTATDSAIQLVGASIAEESLRRSVKTLPDLVSRQGLINLDVEPRLRLVHDPTSQPITARVGDVASAFDASGGRLLIVGEPASGKTIAAYRLAGVIADDTRSDLVPVVVNLSAWAGQTSFEAFLTDYLCSSGAGYGLTNRIAVKQWLDRRRYALILDGLDEVPTTWRAEVLSRLDDWLPVGMAVVLTCRTLEYNNLLTNRHRGIGLAMAVELQPLDDDQLDGAFMEVARRDDPSWSDLVGRWKSGQRRVARDILRRPLVLNLAVASRMTAMQLRRASKDGPDAARASVVDHYLNAVFESDDALKAWARWIASYLTGGHLGPFGTKADDRTVFELHGLAPDIVPWRYAALPVGAAAFLGVSLLGAIGPYRPGWMVTATPLLVLLLLSLPNLRNASPSKFEI